MRRPFLPSKDALSLRSSFLARARPIALATSSLSRDDRIITVAVALCLFANADFVTKSFAAIIAPRRVRCANAAIGHPVCLRVNPLHNEPSTRPEHVPMVDA
jgi:hypothetical protein